MDGGGAGGDDHRHRVDVEDVRGLHDDVRATAQARAGQGGVDRPDGQDRRDRQVVGRERAVGQDHDLDPRVGGGDGVDGQPVQGGFEAGRASGCGPGRGQAMGPDPGGTERGEEPVRIHDDRSCQAHGPWPTRRPAEQARPATQLHPEVHDRALALRVDGRVRDLSEGLAQVVRHRPVEAATPGRRGVVAHAPEWLVRLERHRLDVQAGPLGVQPGQVPGASRQRRMRRHAGRGSVRTVVVDRSRGIVDRHRPQDPGLRVGVLEDGVAARLDEQELSGAKAAASDRLGGGERDGTGLGREAHEPVGRDREGRGSQAVPVDERTDPIPVREDHGRGAVPRREESGGPAAPGGDLRMRRAAQGRGFGDRGDQGRRQRPTSRRQQFERFVERERVRAVRRQKRPGGQQVGGDAVRGHRVRRPSTDLFAVAADGVDLAVVGDRAERLGEPPDRVGIGRVALMEDRVIDGEVGAQVRVQIGQATTRDEALVDDRPAGGRGDRQLRDLSAGRSSGGLGASSGDDQAAVEGVVGDGTRVIGRAGRPYDEGLGEGRPGRGGGGAERRGVRGDLAPAQEPEARLGDRHLDDRPGAGRRGAGSRQEAEEDPGRSGGASGCSGGARDQPKEGPVERQRHAGAIARFAVGPERAAMGQRRQSGERQREHPIARPPAGIRHEPHAARIVFEARVIERVVGRGGWSVAMSEGQDPVSEDGTDRPPPRGVGDDRPGRRCPMGQAV